MLIHDSSELYEQGMYALFLRQIKLHQGNFEAYCIDIKQFSRLVQVHGAHVAEQIAHMMLIEFHGHFATLGELTRIRPDQMLACVPVDMSEQARCAFNSLINSLDKLQYRFDGRRIRIHFIGTQIPFQSAVNPYNVMDIVQAGMREARHRARRVSNSTRYEVEVSQCSDLLERARITRMLKRHVLPSELTLAWQPVLYGKQLKSQFRAEALLRLRHNNGSLQSASFLIDACIQTGQTAFLDNWVITRSLEFLSAHSASLSNLAMLSLNVSPCSLNDDHFLEDTLALLQSHPVQAKKLCLEITEVGSVFNLQQVQHFIASCRKLGVRIGLDDFGAGYSNFRYAIDLKLDIIKIDGAIVRTICHNKSSRAVVAAIARLAKDLGCECVAEWVEDLDTLRELQRLNICNIQGYLIAPAMEPERFFNLESIGHVMADAAADQLSSSLGAG